MTTKVHTLCNQLSKACKFAISLAKELRRDLRPDGSGELTEETRHHLAKWCHARNGEKEAIDICRKIAMLILGYIPDRID